jgi:hypothetical protein
MCKFPPVCLLILSACASPVRAEAETWHDMLSKLEKKVFALRDEEQSIGERIAILEEQSNVLEDHANLLRERLAARGEISSLPQRMIP